MGYDIERFTSPVKEGLICSICRDVLEDPLQSPSCEHAFCAVCIQGWLVHRETCPEDRQHLPRESLKPLFRYMKNDLDSLQIKCKNTQAGCSVICSLENLPSHENSCEYDTIACSNPGCQQTVERRLFSQHMAECDFRTKECPRGCGLTILESADIEHNCVAELRHTLELLRSEMICRLQEQQQEADVRLTTHRRHLVQRENALLRQTAEIQMQVSELKDALQELKQADDNRKLQIQQLQEERADLVRVLHKLQQFILLDLPAAKAIES